MRIHMLSLFCFDAAKIGGKWESHNTFGPLFIKNRYILDMNQMVVRGHNATNIRSLILSLPTEGERTSCGDYYIIW